MTPPELLATAKKNLDSANQLISNGTLTLSEVRSALSHVRAANCAMQELEHRLLNKVLTNPNYDPIRKEITKDDIVQL